MIKNPLLAIKALGQHVWLDNLSRTLLKEGDLQRLITEDGIDGITSNPVILEKAIASSPYYREDRENLLGSHLDAEARYEFLVIPDVQAACDALRPLYVASGGEVGYVSLEISPLLSDDSVAMVGAAKRLHNAVGRENLLIKVPATPAGIESVEQLTAAGVPVNVTLIFSVNHYQSAARAYLRGAMRLLESGGSARQLRSVASVFLSRVDTLVDKRLTAIGTAHAQALKGKAGVALAKLCYQHYRKIFQGPSFVLLRLAHVWPQTPLWASTGTKDPAASDVRYVEPLIGAQTITTLPDITLAAVRDHGRVEDSLMHGMEEAEAHRTLLAGAGIDLEEVGDTLQMEGVQLFMQAYQKLLKQVQE